MKMLAKSFFALVGFFFFTTTPYWAEAASHQSYDLDAPITFQVIKVQLRLIPSNIVLAEILPPAHDMNGAGDYAIKLSLSSKAANALAKLTRENTNHSMNILLNGVVISSPTIRGALGGQLMLTGLTKAQAEAFIQKTTPNRS